MNPNTIATDAATFASETQGIVKALQARIDKEESVLYPLAERI